MGELKGSDVLDIASAFVQEKVDSTEFVRMLAEKNANEQNEICSCIEFYRMLSSSENISKTS